MSFDLYTLVHNTIVTYVNDFKTSPGFSQLEYDVATGLASISDTPLAPDVLVTRVRTNELSGTMQESRTMRTRQREQGDWFWQIHIEFSRDVSLEALKDKMNHEGWKVGRNVQDDNPTVFLDLTEFQMKHNVEIQGSAKGCVALLILNAKVLRPR